MRNRRRNQRSRMFNGRPGVGRRRINDRENLGNNAGNKPGSGPGGSCICPKCGNEIEHTINQPCYDKICPKCGIKMIKK